MRQDFERLLIWLIPVFVIQGIADFWVDEAIKDLYAAQAQMTSGGAGTGVGAQEFSPLLALKIVHEFIQLLPGFVAGIWLWHQEAKRGGRKVLWAVGGVFLKLWILVLYLGAHLIKREPGTEKSEIAT